MLLIYSNEYSIVDAETKYILPTNGLVESWDYKRIFVNPSYGRNSDGTTNETQNLNRRTKPFSFLFCAVGK